MQEYIGDSQAKLHESFSEFKVCRGLREKRDHFAQIFHPARYAIRIGNMNIVDDLLEELERGERMIYDEVGAIFADLRSAAFKSTTKYLERAELSLQQIQKRKSKIKRLARKVHNEI